MACPFGAGPKKHAATFTAFLVPSIQEVLK